MENPQVAFPHSVPLLPVLLLLLLLLLQAVNSRGRAVATEFLRSLAF